MYMIRGLYVLTEKEKEKRKISHRQRLKKIKNRDNSRLDEGKTQLSSAVTIANPRKEIVKLERLEKIDKENK